MSKKVIRLTESQLKEIINDKLAQSYGGDSHSFPHGSGQWNTTEGEKENNMKKSSIKSIKINSNWYLIDIEKELKENIWDEINVGERFIQTVHLKFPTKTTYNLGILQKKEKAYEPTGYKIMKTKKQTLKESVLPQLNKPFTQIVNGLEQENIGFRPVIVRVGQLKPIQNNIEVTKMDGMLDSLQNNKDLGPIWISSDNDILDGHHRAAAIIKNSGRDEKIKCIRIDLDKDNGVRMMNKINDKIDWSEENQKNSELEETKKPKENVLRFNKKQLEEYAKKVIQDNLEEMSIDPQGELVEGPYTVEDVIDIGKGIVKNKFDAYEILKNVGKSEEIISPEDIKREIDNYYQNKRNYKHETPFHGGYHTDFPGYSLNEKELEEGPRTHSSLRSQRLKSQGEKRYASSRMRPSQRDLSEENNNEIKEHDLVTLKVDLPNIPSGTEGTVVHIYNNETFVVEFFQKNKTIAVETVDRTQIEPRSSMESGLSEENIDQDKKYVVIANNKRTGETEILIDPSTKEEAEKFKSNFETIGVAGKYTNFEVVPDTYFDAKMERHPSFEDRYSLNEKEITEDKINEYLKLKEKYNVKTLPSEELSLEEQDKFMEEFNKPLKKKRTIRLNEKQMMEMIKTLQKEYTSNHPYASPAAPVSPGDVSAM